MGDKISVSLATEYVMLTMERRRTTATKRLSRTVLWEQTNATPRVGELLLGRLGGGFPLTVIRVPSSRLMTW